MRVSGSGRGVVAYWWNPKCRDFGTEPLRLRQNLCI